MQNHHHRQCVTSLIRSDDVDAAVRPGEWRCAYVRAYGRGRGLSGENYTRENTACCIMFKQVLHFVQRDVCYVISVTIVISLGLLLNACVCCCCWWLHCMWLSTIRYGM